MTLCTEGQINPDCPVCGAEDSSLSDCKGKSAEEDMAQPEDTSICKHHREHDESCGYQPASENGEGSPCTYECRICPIEELIAALPDVGSITDENAEDVRAQLEQILALFAELTGEEQEQLDLSRCYALQEALDAANAPITADGHTEQQDTDEASVTINGETLYYATLGEAFAAANGKTATITMLTDVECVHSGSNGSPLNINGGNVTLNLNGNALSGRGYGGYGIIDVSGGSLLVQGEKSKVKVASRCLSCRGNGKLTVEGITLELVGDDKFFAGAGILNVGGTVTLNGTQMTGAASDGQIYHYSGTTTINNVTATGVTENCPKSVWYHNEGTLTINGGTFDKIAVESGNGGGVQSVAELLGEGYAYKKQGGTWATDDELAGLEISNVTVAKIPLTIQPQGDTSWYYSAQQTHTLAMNAAPVNGGTVTYVWKSGTETLDCTSDAYTVPADTPVGSYTYTCEATCDDYTLSHTFTFKIEKSGTDLADGKIKTYNGETETTSFTASDTITVKATPTATGQAPAKAAARLRGDPTAGQMVVFVGDTQVCAPADVGADGSYTMNVSAADVLAAAGGPGTGITLTAKFVGNDNMADGAGTVDVSISAVAKIENGSTTTYVGALADAFKTENDGATITLLKDVTRATTLRIKINCTLDLNGHNIKSTNETCLSVASSFAVTIQGEGEIISEQSHALVVAGSVTLKGGTFTGGGSQSAGVNVNGESGSLSVTENVTIQNTGGGYGLAVSNAQSVQLSGGKYSGTAGAIVITSQSSSLTLGGLLGHSDDTRYAYFDESGTTPFTGVLGNKSLTGTVTVKKCNHTGEGVCEYTPNEGAETHAMTCLACGYAGAAEDCQYTYTPDSGGEHHITACQFCGRAKTEAHTYGSWTPEHNENAVTIRRSCENCGYTKTDGTFTAPAPGQTMQYGKPITLTCSSTLPGATFSWSLIGSTAEGTGASFTLPETLAVGSYLYHVTVKWPGSESNICTEMDIFEVTPAPLTATGATAEGRAYDGTNSVEITGVTLAGILNGDDVSVDTTGLTGTLNGSNAGTYTNLTLPAMTLTGADAENYTVTRPAGAVPASVTIRKAAPLTPKTGDLAVANKQEHTYTYGLGALRPDVPEGISLGSTAVTYELGTVSLGSYYDSGAMIDGQTLTLPIKAVESDSETKIGTIT
ncbi:MAG: hypothetical protein K2O45_08030, partial [Oscillospiraceae bacterium]|nr:hypothetical protein [Oscillospiraceae bacterium]